MTTSARYREASLLADGRSVRQRVSEKEAIERARSLQLQNEMCHGIITILSRGATEENREREREGGKGRRQSRKISHLVDRVPADDN